ncbi:MAG TPA: hypothetical protein VF916_02165, partial [Ktedonobacterales bacterium]
MPPVARFVSNRCSLSDPAQVFKSDCLARYDGFLNESLADAVVGVFLEAGFTASQATDATLGIAGPDFLEPLSAPVVAIANEMDDSAREVFAFAVGGQLHDAQVNTERAAVALVFAWGFPALSDVQVRNAGSPDQIGPVDFPRRVSQHLMLAGAQHQTA